jgi:hypothetical protein
VENRIRSEREVQKDDSVLGETKGLFPHIFYPPYEPRVPKCKPDIRGMIGSEKPPVE